jgi:hypothetical protein
MSGQDLYGEHFTKATDFAFSWFPDSEQGSRPLLYHHALDSDAGLAPVGRVKSYEVKADIGVWTQAQLDKSSEYFDAIKDLVKAGKLFFSSGAMAHLVEVDRRSGEIRRWPWVELSLTPTPANLLASVDLVTASKHFELAGLKAVWDEKDPAVGAALKACSQQRVKEMASEMDLDLDETAIAEMMEGAADMSEEDMKKRLTQRKAGKSADPVPGAGDAGAATEPAPAAKAALRAMSWEYIIEQVRQVLQDRLECAAPFGECGYISIEETYSDHIIFCLWQDGTERYFSVPFTSDEDTQSIGVGQPEEVDKTYVPKKPEQPEQPVALMAWTASRYAASLVERTKGLRDRRLKEGRILSAMNRKRLEQCLEAMGGAMTELQGLLDSTAPQPAKAAAVRRQADSLRLYAATLPQN